MRRFDFTYLVENPLLWQEECAVSIGVFDGFHLGHRSIIERNVAWARKEGWHSMVITFNRNPKMVTHSQKMEKRLTSEVQLEQFLDECGVDYLLVIDFSADFSTLTAEEFLILVTTVSTVKMMVVGSDFRCGVAASSAGPVQLQEHLGRLEPGSFVEVPPFIVTDEGLNVSSTLVRKKLLEGALDKVQGMLGRPYTLDVAAYPARINDHGLLYRTKAFTQLLPPPGWYDGRLFDHEGATIDGVVCLTEDELSFTPEDHSRIEGRVGIKGLGLIAKRSTIA
ncbi:MAG: FAD synthetase family protein [Sphaerochaeta sp.]|jgi:riboflavin kinase/FMN adenylyltransferase|nr:FAD synthetase family protein [Sphaerochaeta sp.]MDX9915143.1 FAD synthetase family protein [Sphaerochaeta sp.]